MPVTFNIKPTELTHAQRLESQLNCVGLSTQAFGLLGNVVRRMASVQRSTHIELQQLRHLVFCSDHGVFENYAGEQSASGNSQLQVRKLLSGQAPLANMCTLHNIEMSIIDCGLCCDEMTPRRLFTVNKIAHGCRDFSTVAAMTEAQLEAAVHLGVEQASLKLAEGARVLSFAAIGQGHTLSAAAITMALLKISAKEVIANHNHHEPGIIDDKINILTQALQLHSDQLTDAWQIVRHLGGFETATIMGAMLVTAELGGTFLVDGFACSAALLALHSLYPNIVDYAIFTHQSAYGGQQIIMKHLNQRPLLNLSLSSGEGSGSVLAWPLITSVVTSLQDSIAHSD
ncbi:nicotinate-nucleotide--dimethylbenzimidazole phosphoribosyltransferase [Reinekea marinisedimentorum]|uniref:Nicotinate-nucleotide--dimethylbenzimidazole phosphoribosyltransferase n=1 Tax=Reinekea marinisedimentorum TaxID=230495 RepID=A0A4R3HS11_9GAMM|nr:nicotinate-nucleotide--dimethylbenzimidazole phosphoribosyltransferase [Reinekea marinisedimentorum]TCS35926.1 nicotinate-nucleotide--dimethylbenzimidazole phosphoribosyltransferase [Reinekea marinisedimentorum]